MPWQGRDGYARQLFVAMRHAQRNYGQRRDRSDCAFRDRYGAVGPEGEAAGASACVASGQVRDAAPVYGSGGFTTYTDAQLCDQLRGWVEQGIPRVKMKIGTHPEQDLAPSRRGAAGHRREAQSCLSMRTARTPASRRCIRRAVCGGAERDVVRGAGELGRSLPVCACFATARPPGMDIAAGEYGWNATVPAANDAMPERSM